jgi:hypothetical protein
VFHRRFHLENEIHKQILKIKVDTILKRALKSSFKVVERERYEEGKKEEGRKEGKERTG